MNRGWARQRELGSAGHRPARQWPGQAWIGAARFGKGEGAASAAAFLKVCLIEEFIMSTARPGEVWLERCAERGTVGLGKSWRGMGEGAASSACPSDSDVRRVFQRQGRIVQ